jgi:hypothetical protein
MRDVKEGLSDVKTSEGSDGSLLTYAEYNKLIWLHK